MAAGKGIIGWDLKIYIYISTMSNLVTAHQPAIVALFKKKKAGI